MEKETIREQIKSFFAEMFSPPATKTFSEEDAARRMEALAAPLTAKIAALEGQLKTQAASFAEREKKIAGAETSQRSSEAIAKLRSAGRWLPAFERMGLPLVFAELAKSTETVEFGEGDAKKKVLPLDLLTNFMEKLPKFVAFEDNIVDGKNVLSFGDRRGTAGNFPPQSQNSVQLNEEAKKIQREAKTAISFGEALKEAAQQFPELTQPGAAVGGQV